MIDRDSLTEAMMISELSPLKSGPEWSEAEGVEYEEMMDFCATESKRILTVLKTMGLPVIDVESCMMGMIIGIRYTNLIHCNKVS